MDEFDRVIVNTLQDGLPLCEQPFERIWTDFGGGITRTEAWRERVNEMGEIPVLEEDGARLTQTAPILMRLAARHGRFAGANEAEEFEVLRWLFWDNHKLTSYMATYRFLRAFTPSSEPSVLSFLRKRIDGCLDILERHLRDRAYTIGERATVADISMIGYLCFPSEESGYDLPASHPAVGAWIDRLAALPGWQAPYDLLPGKRLRRYR